MNSKLIVLYLDFYIYVEICVVYKKNMKNTCYINCNYNCCTYFVKTVFFLREFIFNIEKKSSLNRIAFLYFCYSRNLDFYFLH